MAAHAAPDGDPETSIDVSGESPSLSSDPLRRLEAELDGVGGGRSDDEQLYEEAQSLVEEAWGVFTECLVIRDGLLEACQEIERAMSGMQRRLGALSVAVEPGGQERPTGGRPAAASSSNGAATH